MTKRACIAGYTKGANDMKTLIKAPKFNSKVSINNLQAIKREYLSKAHPIKGFLHPKSRKYRLVIIGSGHRIVTNYAPALKALGNEFEVTGIWSRTIDNAKQVAAANEWPLLMNLDHPAIDHADIIVMSITASAAPKILKQILNTTDCSNKQLVIDTPVFSGVRSILHARMLRSFANVTVTEDYMNYPQFELLRKMVNADNVGEIQTITLEHTGYLYHGLALGRSFYDFELVKKVKKTKDCLTYTFSEGKKLNVISPYKQLKGRVVIEGNRGKLYYANSSDYTEYIDNLANYDNLITECWEDKKCVGLIYKCGNQLQRVPLPKLTHDQKSSALFYQFKTLGLIQVFRSLNTQNINSRYHYLQALYDNYVSNGACKKVGGLIRNYQLPMTLLQLAMVTELEVGPFFQGPIIKMSQSKE